VPPEHAEVISRRLSFLTSFQRNESVAIIITERMILRTYRPKSRSGALLLHVQHHFLRRFLLSFNKTTLRFLSCLLSIIPKSLLTESDAVHKRTTPLIIVSHEDYLRLSLSQKRRPHGDKPFLFLTLQTTTIIT